MEIEAPGACPPIVFRSRQAPVPRRQIVIASELAEVLGLSRADGIEIAVKSELNTKIVEVVKKHGLTHGLGNFSIS